MPRNSLTAANRSRRDVNHAGREIPNAALRMAELIDGIISAASCCPEGVAIETGLRCRRRPGRRPCAGYLQVTRLDAANEVGWACSICSAHGTVVNWRGSFADLSLDGEFNPPPTQRPVLLHLTDDEYSLLRTVLLLDLETERMVMGAWHVAEGIRLAGSPEVIQDLIDCVASEGNNEPHWRRRRRLDQLYDRLVQLVDQADLVDWL